MKYYKLIQGGFFEGRYYEARPMNKQGFELNLKHGLITEITEEESTHTPSWGEGIYKEENGIFTCISSHWDSSG